MKNPRLEFRFRLVACLLIGTVLDALPIQAASAPDVTVKVESTGGGEVGTIIKTMGREDDLAFDVKLRNQTGRDQNLAGIQLVLHLETPIADGLSYMIGADAQEPDGQMERLLTGVAAKNDYSNMFVMLRRAENDYALIGLVSWRTFLCRVSIRNGSIVVDGDGDHRLLEAGKDIGFERVVSLSGKSWPELLDRYAAAIVKENRLSAPPAVNWQGWSTWDYYGRPFSASDVEENIKAMEALKVPMNMIQLDGGWWPKRGDYLSARANLPGGIKALVETIHQRGYKAGLHFDGFRAEPSAAIAQQHPEYFLHTADGKLFELHAPNGRERFLVWDYSHPGALAYIEQVMKQAHASWSLDYIKIDFMRHGLEKAVSYLPVTNLERFRMALKAMRAGMGPDVYFLACGANFGSVVGLVDGNRTGQDIAPNYEVVRSKAKHTSGSYYLHRKVYNVDSDYIVLRSKSESDRQDAKRPSLTLEQAEMWSNYVSIYGNARFESDKVSLLDAAKTGLIQHALRMPFFRQTVPLDMWEHYKTPIDAPNVFLANGEDGTICLGIFNWDDGDATFTVSGFGKKAAFQSFHGDTALAAKNGAVQLDLKGTHSLLLRYTGSESFEVLKNKLKTSVKR